MSRSSTQILIVSALAIVLLGAAGLVAIVWFGLNGSALSAPAASASGLDSPAPSQTLAATAVALVRLALNPTLPPTGTPTATFTASLTPSNTPTGTPSPSLTPTATQTFTATFTRTSTSTPTVNPTATEQPHPFGLAGSSYLPVVSDRARAIYQLGLTQGNNPHGFSRLGDCNSTVSDQKDRDFLGAFDTPGTYRLGSYAYLQEVLQAYGGSYRRAGFSSHWGFNLSSYFSAIWADPNNCYGSEDPMDCEYRLFHPGVIFINAGTLNDGSSDAQYEGFMRKIIEFWINKGVVPILNTKADNLEGGNRFNAIIRRLAVEYDVPLWDYWQVSQALPNGGMGGDNVHLSVGLPYFDDPNQMETGWTLRNLTGLQALDAVWHGLQQ